MDLPPPPPPANVARTNPDGSPTKAVVDYETRLYEWLRRLAQRG